MDNYSTSSTGRQILNRRKTSVSNSNSRASTPNSRDDFPEELCCGLDPNLDNDVEDELEDEAFENNLESKDEDEDSNAGSSSVMDTSLQTLSALVENNKESHNTAEKSTYQTNGSVRPADNQRPKRERGLTGMYDNL